MDAAPSPTPSRVSAWRVPAWLERATGWAWRLLVLAAGVVALVWLVGRLRLVLIPVLIGLLLAALATPLASWLSDHRVPRLVSAWMTLLLAAAVVAGIGWLGVVAVGDQLADGERWDQVQTEVRTWLSNGPLGLSSGEIDDLERRVRDTVVGGVSTVNVERVRIVAEIVGAIFLSAVLFFFFVKDGPKLWARTVDRFKPRRRDDIDVAGRAAFEALTGYMRGVAITGVIDAVAIGIALWIIGVPLVLPLAVLTFFGAFFPIVGATVAGALATLVALVLNGPGDALLVALVTLAVQQLEGDLVMPLVMRRQVNLHPVTILVALATGGAMAGITGAFVAVPVAAMIAGASTALREAREDGADARPEADAPAEAA